MVSRSKKKKFFLAVILALKSNELKYGLRFKCRLSDHVFSLTLTLPASHPDLECHDYWN